MSAWAYRSDWNTVIEVILRGSRVTYTTAHEGLAGRDMAGELTSVTDGIGVLVLAHLCGGGVGFLYKRRESL